MSPDHAPSDHRSPSLTGTLLLLLAGPILWAVHLTIVYGVHTLACVGALQGMPVDAGTFILVATGAILAILMLLLAVIWLRRPALFTHGDRLFHSRVMVSLVLLSAFGIAWAGSAAFILPQCQQLR